MQEKKIGQFRKTQLQHYLTPLKFSLEDIITSIEKSSIVKFIDKKIVTTLIQDKSYYLNFGCWRCTDEDQVISIYLKNSKNTNISIQKITTITITTGKPQWLSIDILITPMNDYDEIVFELQRNIKDFQIKNRHDTYGRETSLDIYMLAEVYNVLNSLNISKIYKLGVQGPSGLLMSINGEPIRIGRSGIYEIPYPITITSIGFVVKDNIDNMEKQDYFIMDYQY